jgi:hypothetical protein
VHLAGH